MTKHESNPMRRRRRLRQLTGAVICLLVLIGVGSLIASGIDLVAKLTDNSAEKLEFEKRISNLVPYDPVPFDSLAEANQSVLLASSIWGTISEIDQTVLERDDIGQPFLPVIDVDRWAAQLYGPEYKLTHGTFEDHGVIYTYVEEKQAYLIPITSALMDYSPTVVKIKREGNTKCVTVGYISPFMPGGEYNTSGILEPVKYHDYIFTKIDKVYYLSAITDSEMKAPEGLDPNAPNSSSMAVIDPGAFIDENAQSQAQSTVPEDVSSAPASSAAQ